MTADTAHIEVDRPFAHKVEAMAGYGLPAVDIALVLAMDLGELQSIYRHELETGSIKANLRVSESLYRQALGGRLSGGHGCDLLAQDPGTLEGNARRGAAGRATCPVINFKVVYEEPPPKGQTYAPTRIAGQLQSDGLACAAVAPGLIVGNWVDGRI